MIHRRWSDPQFVFLLTADEAASLLLFALDKEEEELLFRRWIVQAQYEMSFDDFKASLKPRIIKTDREIIEDVKSIMKGWEVSNGIV